ncbi:MAG: hypothetical protein WCK03_01790 [Candidatus Taylorbacteria bacterium]
MSARSIINPILVSVATGTLALGVGNYIWKNENRPKILEVYVFALKSGRSVFIRTPNDKRILIDGGANSDIIRELTEIIPFYSKRIDTIIATNTDGKNISGLIDVLDRYVVDHIYQPSITTKSLMLTRSTDQIYETFIGELTKKGIEVHNITASESLRLDTGVDARILFPTNKTDFVYSKASAPELLMTITYGKTSITLLGSASLKIQKYIATSLETPIINDGRVIKDMKESVVIFSNSALPTNISKSLIDKLEPKYFVYSKILNSSSKTLQKAKIDPLSIVDIDKRVNLKETGNIHFVSDGSSIDIK